VNCSADVDTTRCGGVVGQCSRAVQRGQIHMGCVCLDDLTLAPSPLAFPLWPVADT
jgi:hypothetical protein